jgi:DNA-binding FadR family transcriptional regulator
MSIEYGKRGLGFQLAETIGPRIASGEYPPDHVISPDALCITMGLSRTAVREGLRVLEAKGMIYARPNIGTRVKPVTCWNLLDPDISRWVGGTELGEELHDAAVELAAIVETKELPENPLYCRMRQLLATYALNAPPFPPAHNMADRPEVSA